jgi:hypothetical protein
MGILQSVDWLTALIAFATAVTLGPLRMIVKGLGLRMLGASKAEVKSWALKVADTTSENALVSR